MIRRQTVIGFALLCMLTAPMLGAIAAETPKRGGVLTFVVAGGAPSFDAHRELTFSVIHPVAPFYSVLIRVNPDNPSSTTDFVCDLCVMVPKPMDDGKKYVFKILRHVRFHDGSALTANDIVASYRKIIFPPKGVISSRKAHFSMVKNIYAPDDYTVVFELKHPSGGFIPALATPFNFIYSKKILDRDIHWYEKNVMGSGPFKFSKQKPGVFIEGVRNPDYHHKGKPYLDGFRATFVKQQSKRVEAIREERAMIEFRGFPPQIRDTMNRNLGDQITVQESDWNCALMVVPNHKVKPFDDPRVRLALTLALDRWGGAQHLSRIAIVKTVGGVVFPGHPLAATKEELEKIAGYWPDLEKSRAEARRLLTEAGYPDGIAFTLHNRAVDQPYRVFGAWLIGQWQKVGFKVNHKVQPTEAYFASLHGKKDFQVSIDFNCQAVVNPLLDIAKFISDDRTSNNNANYRDRRMDKLFDAMNRSGDQEEQRRIMRKFEKRALDEQAHQFLTLWFYRIILHRSYVKGWKISPSHYINQDLGNVWLAQ